MKQLILLGLAVLVLTNRKRTTTTGNKTQTEQPLPTKKNTDKDNGENTGGNGGGGTVNNGTYWFSFTTPSNPNNEPEIFVQLPSNSRVALPTGEANGNDTANCEYWIYDSAGNVVANMNDTYGAHHPNFFPSSSQYHLQTQSVKDKVAQLSGSFVAVNPFTSYESKGNNHMDFFRRKMKEGVYRWVINNKSNLKTNVFVGFTNSETENVQHYFDIEANSQQEIYFEVKPHPEGLTADIKLNINNYRR